MTDLAGYGMNVRSLQNHINVHISGIGPAIYPHHPTTCNGPLYITNQEMWCDHVKVPYVDERLQAALGVSICELLMELARTL